MYARHNVLEQKTERYRGVGRKGKEERR